MNQPIFLRTLIALAIWCLVSCSAQSSFAQEVKVTKGNKQQFLWLGGSEKRACYIPKGKRVRLGKLNTKSLAVGAKWSSINVSKQISDFSKEIKKLQKQLASASKRTTKLEIKSAIKSLNKKTADLYIAKDSCFWFGEQFINGSPKPPLTCPELESESPEIQEAVIVSNVSCSTDYFKKFIANPAKYVDSFLKLVSNPAVGYDFFTAYSVLQQAGSFQISSTSVLDKLYADFPGAMTQCAAAGGSICQYWDFYFPYDLKFGSYYKCGDQTGLSESVLLSNLDYAGYYCAETITNRLIPFASSDLIAKLLTAAQTKPRFYSRRNALRVLARWVYSTDANLVGVIANNTSSIKSVLLERLQVETDFWVLSDAVYTALHFQNWPELQPPLVTIASNATNEPALRFRALTGLYGLFDSQPGVLSSANVNTILTFLSDSDRYLRAQSAYYINYFIGNNRFTVGDQNQLLTAVNTAWGSETDYVKVYLAKTLDSQDSGNRYATLKSDYESIHLTHSLTSGPFTIRSGLPDVELPAIMSILNWETSAYHDLLGATFSTPVLGDANPTMTLIVFATKAEYHDYMDAFVGFAADAGGLYIEGDALLYTFERTSSESIYTKEELIKHEFGHYLNGRFIFPGKFSDSDYADQPKAWADEGFAEFLGGLSFDSQGNYTVTQRQSHLDNICNAQEQDLTALLSQKWENWSQLDYSWGWGINYYLATQRKDLELTIFSAFRSDVYDLANFDAIFGQSVASLQTDYRTYIHNLCLTRPAHSTFGPAESVHSEVLHLNNLPGANLPARSLPIEGNAALLSGSAGALTRRQRPS